MSEPDEMDEAMRAMRAMRRIMDAFHTNLQAVRDFARASAEDNIKLREILREYKTLKGE